MKVTMLNEYMGECKKRSIEPTFEGLYNFVKIDMMFKDLEVLVENTYKARASKDVPFIGKRLSLKVMQDYCEFCKKYEVEADFETAYYWEEKFNPRAV